MDNGITDRLKLLERIQEEQLPEEFKENADEFILCFLNDIRQDLQRLVEKKNDLAWMLGRAEEREKEANDEKNALQSRLREAVGDSEALRKEMERSKSEIKDLRREVSGLSHISDVLKGERDALETELKEAGERIGMLENEKEEVECRLKKAALARMPDREFVSSMKRSFLKRSEMMYVTACLLAAAAIAGIIIFAGGFNLRETSGTKASRVEIAGVWPKSPVRLDSENFTFTVELLGSDAMDRLSIPLALYDSERHQYLIEIGDRKGLFPREFIKSPLISFIGEDGRLVKLGSPGVEVKYADIYRSAGGRREKDKISRVRYIISVSRDHRPKGILIKGVDDNIFYKIM